MCIQIELQNIVGLSCTSSLKSSIISANPFLQHISTDNFFCVTFEVFKIMYFKSFLPIVLTKLTHFFFLLLIPPMRYVNFVLNQSSLWSPASTALLEFSFSRGYHSLMYVSFHTHNFCSGFSLLHTSNRFLIVRRIFCLPKFWKALFFVV